MKYWIGKNIYLVPPIMVLLTLMLSFMKISNDNWLIIGNSSGYSVLVLLPILYFYLCTGKYCDFTKASVVGLFVISVFNTISAIITKYDKSIETFRTYESDFSILVCALVIILSFILYLKKR